MSLHPAVRGSTVLTCAPCGEAPGPVSPEDGQAAALNANDRAQLAFHRYSNRDDPAGKMTCVQVGGTAVEPPTLG